MLTTSSVGLRGEIVAVLLTHRGRVCLLRRSIAVSSDRGRWHCVTGFLPPRREAKVQAVAEVFEETGLSRADLKSFVAGPVLNLADARGGHWRVHAYRCEIAHPEIELNWENDAISWIRPAQFERLPIVEWLPQVAAAVGIDEGNTKWDG